MAARGVHSARAARSRRRSRWRLQGRQGWADACTVNVQRTAVIRHAAQAPHTPWRVFDLVPRLGRVSYAQLCAVHSAAKHKQSASSSRRTGPGRRAPGSALACGTPQRCRRGTLLACCRRRTCDVACKTAYWSTPGARAQLQPMGVGGGPRGQHQRGATGCRNSEGARPHVSDQPPRGRGQGVGCSTDERQQAKWAGNSNWARRQPEVLARHGAPGGQGRAVQAAAQPPGRCRLDCTNRHAACPVVAAALLGCGRGVVEVDRLLRERGARQSDSATARLMHAR